MYRSASAPYQFGWKAGGKSPYPFPLQTFEIILVWTFNTRSWWTELFNCICGSEVGSFFLWCPFQGSTGYQDCWQVSSSVEPSCWLKKKKPHKKLCIIKDNHMSARAVAQQLRMHCLLFQRIWAQFPAPTSGITVVYNSSTYPLTTHMHIYIIKASRLSRS